MNNQPEFNQDDLDAFLDQQMKLTQWEEPSDEQVENLKQFWCSLSESQLEEAKFDDSLLENTQWEEASDDQLKRLEGFWSSLSDDPVIARPAQKKQYWLRSAGRVAICFAIVVSFIFLVWNSNKTEIVTDVQNPSDNIISVTPSMKEQDDSDSRIEKKEVVTVKKDVAVGGPAQHEMKKFTETVVQKSSSRLPTAYEMFLLQSRQGISTGDKRSRVNQRKLIHKRNIEYKKAVSKFIKSINQIPGFVRVSQSLLEKYLLNQIPLMNIDGQNELIRMLAVVGGKRSVSSLVGFINHSLIRKESFKSLTKIATSQELSRMVPYLRVKSERMMIYQELLLRNDDASLYIYFEFVKNRVARNEALNVLSHVDDLNYDFFFKIMDHSQSSDQMLAAIVLGRSNNTEVVYKLLEKTSQQTNRKAAVIALLVSNHEEATRFINNAARYPVWLAEINSVKTQLATNVY